MKPQFKAGDWVFCEFKLSLIKETDGDRVREVSDGFFSHSSSDLSDRCFPLDIRIKQISDNYEAASARLHREGGPGLNYPDFHRWLVEQWVASCERKDENEFLKTQIRKCEDFVTEVLDKTKNSVLSNGLRLHR